MPINISIVYAKREKSDFDRYTFPLLGRPVAYYPIHAALNTSIMYKVYLSTDSPKLTLYGSRITGLTLIPREHSQSTLTEEIKKSLHFVLQNNSQKINTITIQFANSPCITNDLIFNAISFLDDNKNYDSVVTCMRRGEFSPARMFSYNNEELVQDENLLDYNENVYFLDHRLMVVRPDCILDNDIKSNNVETVLGQKIHPVIQQEGVWDIDYPWQIPHVERWLRKNDFSDTKSIYELDRVKLKEKVNPEKLKSKDIQKLLITTVPFGENNTKPLEMIEGTNSIKYTINPLNRKLKENELCEMIPGFDLLIAGTEPITMKVLNNADKLKIISRVGVGLDNVDLNVARERGIQVCYTPDAPSPAVAELTIAHMLNLLRHIPSVDYKMRSGIWNRIQGQRLANLTIGIIGIGRIGLRVLKHLQGFDPVRILVNDLNPREDIYKIFNAHHVEKEEIYTSADIISLHVPLTNMTRNLITKNELKLMRPSTVVINTSRGGIINENDLFECLTSNQISGAAIDVFETEPYSGRLVELENCYFSCHMGSMTKDCREKMEIEATEEIVRFVSHVDLRSQVPEQEYINQMER